MIVKHKKTPASSYSPTSKGGSTIGAGGLNGRVRDGNGCGPSAIETGGIFLLQEVVPYRRSLSSPLLDSIFLAP